MPQMPSVHSSQAGLPPRFVVGFGKMVEVFSSKQRPKKLTIYGDDFKWVLLAVSRAPLPITGVMLGRELDKKQGEEEQDAVGYLAGGLWGRECSLVWGAGWVGGGATLSNLVADTTY